MQKAVDLHPFIWALLPAHYEMAIWGWVVQLAMGTAYWMFPRRLDEPKRGPLWAGWSIFILFNTGLVFLIISTLFRSLIYTAIFGRTLILIAILIFAILMWQRIVTYRKHH